MSIWHNMSLAIIQLSELLPTKTNRKIPAIKFFSTF